MYNIFNNAKTLYDAYNSAQKKKTPDLYFGPTPSVYKPPQGAPRPQTAGSKPAAATGSPKAPQPPHTPASVATKKVTPPPTTQPTVPQVKQPTASDIFQQKYSEYLRQSQANKEKLAEQNRQDTEAKAMESYNANKTIADTSKANLESMMSGFRERSAAGQARLDAQAQQNRERASRTSGESQRQLMETRRDQLGDVERRYSALGTVDSYGTGSFQSANQNVENDFLRLTASNKQKLQDDLLDIDNKLFDAKAQAEEKIAVEEAKYKDALSQIQQLLVGNEVEKNQAIRAAQSLLQQKKAEIYDEYEGYRIQAEKEKVTKQAEIDSANASDLKIQEMLKGASQEFMTTGVPKTSQDQFIIMKYPKEAEAYAKLVNPQSKNKPTEKQAQFANAAKSGEYALNLLSSGKVNTGIGQDVLGSYQEKWGGASDTQQDYRSTIAAARTLARNAMLGANMTPKEMESLSALIPEYNDDINIAKQKLTTFVREMNRFANMDVQMQSGLTPEMIQGLQAFEK